MTTPNGPVLFNSSTGSDTAASGLGPATALSGAGASTTAASGVVTGIVTTGVTSGDLLWVGSTSGRRFSVIASVDSGTQVTCDDVFVNTESSRNWGIGGKRKSIAGSAYNFDNAAIDFNGVEFIQFEDGYTESTTARMRFRSPTNYSSPLTLRTEPNAAVNARFTSNYTSDPFVFGSSQTNIYERLEFEQTNPAGSCAASGSGAGTFKYCKFGVGATKPTSAYQTSRPETFIGCEFYSAGPSCVSQTDEASFIECLFNGGTTGMEVTGAGATGFLVKGCIFEGQVDGILMNNGGGTLRQWKFFVDNIFNCTNSALRFTTGDSLRKVTIHFSGNIIANSTYGIEYPVGMTLYPPSLGVYRNNAFCNIGTSNYLNSYGGQVGDVSAGSDPFVDSANGDYSLNETAGGGAVLRAAAHTVIQTTVHQYNQLTDGSGGGGGGATHYDPFTNPRF